MKIRVLGSVVIILSLLVVTSLNIEAKSYKLKIDCHGETIKGHGPFAFREAHTSDVSRSNMLSIGFHYCQDALKKQGGVKNYSVRYSDGKKDIGYWGTALIVDCRDDKAHFIGSGVTFGFYNDPNAMRLSAYYYCKDRSYGKKVGDFSYRWYDFDQSRVIGYSDLPADTFSVDVECNYGTKTQTTKKITGNARTAGGINQYDILEAAFSYCSSKSIQNLFSFRGTFYSPKKEKGAFATSFLGYPLQVECLVDGKAQHTGSTFVPSLADSVMKDAAAYYCVNKLNISDTTALSITYNSFSKNEKPLVYKDLPLYQTFVTCKEGTKADIVNRPLQKLTETLNLADSKTTQSLADAGRSYCSYIQRQQKKKTQYTDGVVTVLYGTKTVATIPFITVPKNSFKVTLFDSAGVMVDYTNNDPKWGAIAPSVGSNAPNNSYAMWDVIKRYASPCQMDSKKSLKNTLPCVGFPAVVSRENPLRETSLYACKFFAPGPLYGAKKGTLMYGQGALDDSSKTNILQMQKDMFAPCSASVTSCNIFMPPKLPAVQESYITKMMSYDKQLLKSSLSGLVAQFSMIPVSTNDFGQTGWGYLSDYLNGISQQQVTGDRANIKAEELFSGQLNYDVTKYYPSKTATQAPQFQLLFVKNKTLDTVSTTLGTW